MSQDNWHKLRDWLTRVFGETEGEKMFADHVKEARKNGLELPQDK
jgi:hypothetical protein